MSISFSDTNITKEDSLSKESFQAEFVQILKEMEKINYKLEKIMDKLQEEQQDQQPMPFDPEDHLRPIKEL